MKANVLKTSLIALGMTVVLGIAAPARATILLPGTTAPPDSVTLTGQNPGVLLASTSSVFATSGGTTGTVLSAVYRQIGDTLDFYYQVFVDNDPVNNDDGIQIVGMQSFTGFLTDVYVRNDDPDGGSGPFVNGDQGPVNADRSGTGNIVHFNFFVSPLGVKINEGLSSDVLVIRTDASQFQFRADAVSVTNGGVDSVNSFEPVPGSQVPEPGSMILLGSGLLGMAAALRRRRQSAV